jgi:tungstate transport system substrate-binding protein
VTTRRAVLAAVLLLVACRANTPPLILATTTSVANSGLLDRLLPAYVPQPVRVIQVGSGRALAMLEANRADIVISHAPEREAETLRRHPTWFYRKFLYNDFLIVGPADDPASIAGLTDAAEAMKRILQSGHRFLSRGDESGTHEREGQLWTAAGLEPKPDQVIVAGAGMGQTLRIASETGMYTLTDRGTFEMLSSSLRLKTLLAGDSRLLNTYAILTDPANERGVKFARWLVDGDGRSLLTDVLSSGEIRGFTVWPADRAGTRPESRPF